MMTNAEYKNFDNLGDNLSRFTTDNNDDISIIDEAQFEEMRELLEEDFADLLQTFIDDSKQRIVMMKAAQANNDNANGFEFSHALKGASATLGATQLVVLSEQLEEACRMQEVCEQNHLIEQISIALQKVEKEINQRLEL